MFNLIKFHVWPPQKINCAHMSAFALVRNRFYSITMERNIKRFWKTVIINLQLEFEWKRPDINLMITVYNYQAQTNV